MHSDWDPGPQINKEIAAAFLIRAWEAVTPEVLDDTWAVYEFEDD
jgi:hypothetical protein